MRSYITYTSILSVVADIHSMVDSNDWDEDKMIEWALKGLRKLNLPAKYEDTVKFIEVIDHSAALPADIKYINQMFFKEDFTTYSDAVDKIREIISLTDNDTSTEHVATPDSFATKLLEHTSFKSGYKPLHRASGSFGTDLCAYDKVPRKNCTHRYTIYGKQAIQTTFKNGCIALSYKRYVKDCDGYDLVPDNEDLKDALFHFCMYRWWMSRMTYKEQGAGQQMNYHKTEYMYLGAKAVGNINSPDIDTLENIKNNRNRLVPREYFYDNGFSQLSGREDINF